MQVLVAGRVTDSEIAELRTLGRLAEKVGCRLYVVGGWVRDVLLGRSHKDRDLTVEGDARAFAEALGEAHLPWLCDTRGDTHARIEWHEQFLTASISFGGGPEACVVDIATTRSETYSRPGALPTVEPADIATDLWRRDFACNALAVSLCPASFGETLDPCAGREDIRQRVLRVLHAGSFVDDPTRILRGVNLEQRLGFRFELTTERLLREAIAGGALRTVSADRVREALRQGLANEAAAGIVGRLEELGVWSALVEGAGAGTGAAALEVERSLLELGLADPQARVAAHLAAVATAGGDVAAWSAYLAPEEQRAAEALTRLAAETPEALRDAEALPSAVFFALEGGTPVAVVVLHSRQVGAARERMARYWREWRTVAADITGDDLRRAGCMPGPQFRAGLRAALAAKLDRNASREEQLRIATQIASTGTC